MHPSPADHGASALASVLTYGPLALDLTGFTVTVHGRDVPLTFSEFLVFKELALHPTRVVDRATLFAALGARAFEHRQAHGARAFEHRQAHGSESPRTVDLHVSRIRRKLAKAGYDCIRTMRFVGYRFVPPDAVG